MGTEGTFRGVDGGTYRNYPPAAASVRRSSAWSCVGRMAGFDAVLVALRPPAGRRILANVSDHVKPPGPVAKADDVINEPPPTIDQSMRVNLSLMRHPRALVWDPALPELLGAPKYECLTADAKGTRRSTASRMIAHAL